MAAPQVLVGTKLLILVGDGASPETFSEPCGLTTKSFNFAAATNETLIPDCDDPEAPAWAAKDVNSLSATLTGSGVMAVESFDTWQDWFMSATSRSIQIKLDDPELGQWEGTFIISGLNYGGQRGQKVTLEVTMVNDGAVVWNAN